MRRSGRGEIVSYELTTRANFSIRSRRHLNALVPWFFFSSRTMFYFYALPAEPFLILAVIYVLGCIMTPPPHE